MFENTDIHTEPDVEPDSTGVTVPRSRVDFLRIYPLTHLLLSGVPQIDTLSRAMPSPNQYHHGQISGITNWPRRSLRAGVPRSLTVLAEASRCWQKPHGAGSGSMFRTI